MFSGDTVGITLTFVFNHLALHPVSQTLVRDALSKIPLTSDIQLFQKLPGLQSVITETLWLHPPVSTGAPRESGPPGLPIADQFFPSYVILVVSRYTVARRKYSQPTKFGAAMRQVLRALHGQS